MKRIDIPVMLRAATDKILGTVRLTGNVLTKVKNSAPSVEGIRNSTILRANTEAELKAMDLEENNVVDVLGKATQDDGKGYRVRIVKTQSPGSIPLSNGLHAVIINDIASADKLGKIKVGSSLAISEDGVLSARLVTPEELVQVIEKHKGDGA